MKNNEKYLENNEKTMNIMKNQWNIILKNAALVERCGFQEKIRVPREKSRRHSNPFSPEGIQILFI